MKVTYCGAIDKLVEARALPRSSCKVILPPGHVIDEDKSVKWNRAEVERLNAECREEDILLRKAKYDAEIEAINYAGRYLAQEYKLSEGVGIKVFKFALHEKDSVYTIGDILDYAEELCQLFKEEI